MIDNEVDLKIFDSRYKVVSIPIKTWICCRNRELTAMSQTVISQKERIRREKRTRLFSTRDFTFDPDFRFCICPAGKRLYRSGSNVDRKGCYMTRFKGPKSACVPCHLRVQCLRHPDRTQIRQVAFFHDRKKIPITPAERMKQKIDSPSGKLIYSQRIGTVEPVFANIRHMLRLDRFNFRGKLKVNCQWLLFCTVHNLKKLHRYGLAHGT